MEFRLILFGVLVGKLWTWLAGRWLQTAPITRRAPARQLGAHIAIAAITGALIGLVELQLFSSARLASTLSKGLIAGFVWSPWFLGSVCLLRSRHQIARAYAYLTAAPVLGFVAVIGGYLSLHLNHSFT